MRTAAKRAWAAAASSRMIGETGDFLDILQRFVNRPHVVGGVVHDARMAAMCVAHAVEASFTLDRDFSLFPELRTHGPSKPGGRSANIEPAARDLPGVPSGSRRTNMYRFGMKFRLMYIDMSIRGSQ